MNIITTLLGFNKRKKVGFNDLSTDIKQHIFLFLRLKEYNYFYFLFKQETNYTLYFKRHLFTTPETIEVIIMEGACTLPLVKFIYPEHLEIPRSDTKSMLYYASDTNYLMLFKYLYNRTSRDTLYEYLFDLQKVPSLNIIKFLHKEDAFLKYEKSGDVMISVAIIKNKISIVEYLHNEVGIKLPFDLLDFLTGNCTKYRCIEKNCDHTRRRLVENAMKDRKNKLS